MVPGILRVEAALLARHLGCAAQWARIDGRSGAPSPIDPPNDVVAHILSMVNDWQFKPLTGIISTPTLRPDGTILDQSGYDDTTGLVLFEPPPMPPIPAAPTKDDAAAALKLLDRLAEFPFAGDDEMREAHRSVARSMLMTPVLRGAVGATAPLHVVRSPHAGSGEEFYPIWRRSSPRVNCARSSARRRKKKSSKKLHTAAMTGQSIISLDNVNGTLTSDFLAQLIERPLLLVRARDAANRSRSPTRSRSLPTATISRSVGTSRAARSSVRSTPTWRTPSGGGSSAIRSVWSWPTGLRTSPRS